MRTLILMVCLMASPLHADYDFEEGRTLTLIVEELDYLIGLSEDQARRPSSNDLTFSYQALGADLLRIRELIRFHMENATKQPNQITPRKDGSDPVSGVYSHRNL